MYGRSWSFRYMGVMSCIHLYVSSKILKTILCSTGSQRKSRSTSVIWSEQILHLILFWNSTSNSLMSLQRCNELWTVCNRSTSPEVPAWVLRPKGGANSCPYAMVTGRWYGRSIVQHLLVTVPTSRLMVVLLTCVDELRRSETFKQRFSKRTDSQVSSSSPRRECRWGHP